MCFTNRKLPGRQLQARERDGRDRCRLYLDGDVGALALALVLEITTVATRAMAVNENQELIF